MDEQVSLEELPLKVQRLYLQGKMAVILKMIKDLKGAAGIIERQIEQINKNLEREKS